MLGRPLSADRRLALRFGNPYHFPVFLNKVF